MLKTNENKTKAQAKGRKQLRSVRKDVYVKSVFIEVDKGTSLNYFMTKKYIYDINETSFSDRKFNA